MRYCEEGEGRGEDGEVNTRYTTCPPAPAPAPTPAPALTTGLATSSLSFIKSLEFILNILLY